MDQQLPKVQRYHDYREMLDKQKDIDGVVVATPDHMHAIIASAAMDAGKHVYVQKPLCWSVQEARHLAQKAQDDQARHADGQPGAFARRRAARLRVHHGGRDRRGQRSARLDQPAAGLLAAGRAASRAASRRRSCRWNGKGVEQRLAASLGDGYPVPKDLSLGPVPRRGAAGRLPPDLSPVQLARLDRLGSGRARRHGRAPHRSSVLVARSRLPDGDRDDLDAVQRRLLPERDDDLLRVPGARRDAAGAS